MSKSPILKADKRKVFGRKSKRLRNEGILPSNVYGKDLKSFAVQVDLKDFQKVYKQVGETSLVELSLGAKKHAVLIHNAQIDPVTDAYLHVDFLQVNLKEKVKTHTPVELIGVSPAEKTGLGTLVQHLDEVEVEALPGDLPDKFEVDVSVLDDTEKRLTVADIKVDSKKVSILTDKEILLAKVEEVKEVEEEPVPVAEVEGEETGDSEGTDGEESKDSEDGKPESDSKETSESK